MKLYYTPTSPFVRKVMVAAHELSLEGRIETTFLRPSPLATDPELSRTNPISKIPALVLDDGTVLFDSRVICEYLDSLAVAEGKRPLVPASGPDRFRTLRLQALADGILEAGVQVFYERTHRPEALQWAPWIDGQTQKAQQGLDALEREAASFGALDLGQIAAAATIAWLEFRKVVPNVLASRPNLAAWFERTAARPSMQATVPRA